jgi:secondary thiamine-phosphate synthase enzyme
MLKELKITTQRKHEFVDITSFVRTAVSESGAKSGLCVVYCPHTTAGIVINENADPDVKTDLLNALEAMVPKIEFKHDEGNSDAHLKSALVGKEKTLIIEEGALELGSWDGIFFAEFDGPRQRKILVKIMAEQ